mmetsp:Transcript_49172/g.119168  ORF Transcript_49172/g.119168 Transcript_49172/m.119168 type:complete len:212 (-) Transcript_49172:172-807(-)
MEQMKADLLASVVSNPTAWETYPIEFHNPTSNPNHRTFQISSSLESLAAWTPVPVFSSELLLIVLLNRNGDVASAARPNRNVVEIPTGIVSPNNFTREKLVPYSAAAPINNNRARHTSASSVLLSSKVVDNALVTVPSRVLISLITAKDSSRLANVLALSSFAQDVSDRAAKAMLVEAATDVMESAAAAAPLPPDDDDTFDDGDIDIEISG